MKELEKEKITFRQWFLLAFWILYTIKYLAYTEVNVIFPAILTIYYIYKGWL